MLIEFVIFIIVILVILNCLMEIVSLEESSKVGVVIITAVIEAFNLFFVRYSETIYDFACQLLQEVVYTLALSIYKN
jgi:hypothetical protein